MKRLLLGVLTIMVLLMSGCGEGVRVVVPIVPVISPPSITSYQFTKDPVAKLINGSIAFYAPDSDVYSMTVVVFDSGGNTKSRITSFPSFPGAIRGTIPFSIDYFTYPAGTFTFSIYLTDFNGNSSGQIVDTFSVP
jgi:hypothetical protein